jgi:hypothetical protein
MSFYGSPRHLKLTGNLRVVTTLQKQFDDLLFTWAQPNRLFLHRFPLFLVLPSQIRARLNLTKSHSIHIAILRWRLSVTLEHYFPQALADNAPAFWVRGRMY